MTLSSLITRVESATGPDREREAAARAECARLGIDPDELCADGGVEAWMVVDQQLRAARARQENDGA